MYLVSYDIESDRCRRKIAKCLENYGKRIQYSVFECDLDEKRLKRLYHQLMKESESMVSGSIRIYYICGNCQTKVKIIGDEIVSTFHSGKGTIVI